MNVSLTPELERVVNERVESGMYQTASEVVREALLIDVNYLCRLATIVLAGPPDGRGCDSPAAG